MGRDKKPFTKQSIHEVSESLKRLTGEVAAFSDKLVDTKFDKTLCVDAGASMYEGLGWIADWLSKLEAAHRSALLPIPVVSDECKDEPEVKPEAKPVKNGKGKK